MEDHRQLIAGLRSAPPVVIDGHEYTGGYLAALVAIDPELPDAEQADSARIIAELGRLVARAYVAKQRAELEYRIWREERIWSVINDISAAEMSGFECAKKAKLPSNAAAETWTRTLPEYRTHHEAILLADEAWQTVSVALDAAKARSWALRAMAATSGEASYGRTSPDYPRRIEHVATAEDVAYPDPAGPPPVPPPPPPRTR